MTFKVILDTNVVIASGWKHESICCSVLDAIFYKRLATCYVSQEILQEYKETADDRKFQRIQRNLQKQIRRVRRHAFLAVPQTSVQVLPDPDDDKFLDLAREVQADYLVTGDLDAFGDLQLFETTYIVTPVEFLNILKKLNLL